MSAETLAALKYADALDAKAATLPADDPQAAILRQRAREIRDQIWRAAR